jgi:hypothetical protein
VDRVVNTGPLSHSKNPGSYFATLGGGWNAGLAASSHFPPHPPEGWLAMTG